MRRRNEASPTRALGLRCEPNKLHYAVVTLHRDDVVIETSAVHKYPAALHEAQVLHRLVQEVRDVVQHNRIDRVGLKSVEPMAGKQGLSAGLVKRIHAEGAILSMLGGTDTRCEMLLSNSIKQRLEVSRPLAQYVDNPDLSSLPYLGSVKNRVTREAILAGLAVAVTP